MTGLTACTGGARPPIPVTITLLDPGWPDREFVQWRKHEEEDFMRETGILVRDLPAPETAIDQLALWRKLLENPSEAPDVFAIDVIWPPVMADYSLPLNRYLSDTAADFPSLVVNDMVNGELVALPYHADAGLLFYRTDLLRKYGYRAPPDTWDELEKMAARIQEGERSKGERDFWGFVWQGAASEALTCNALEWQASEGGGLIIGQDGTITVNNRDTIRAWERAARWVGSISPPSVVAYREWDSLNIWRSGNAAFMRNWPTSFVTSQSEGSAIRGRFAATLLPRGRAGHVGTLGGASLSVFRGTRHSPEAVALVRYLVRRDVEFNRILATSQPPVFPELFDDPSALRAAPHLAKLKELFRDGVVARPSTVAGTKYIEVSQAYVTAVHSVLTGRTSASEAAADLEKALVLLTGFHPRKDFPSVDAKISRHSRRN
jgi:trehalose/maltose transport system substrate-binding protein